MIIVIVIITIIIIIIIILLIIIVIVPNFLNQYFYFFQVSVVLTFLPLTFTFPNTLPAKNLEVAGEAEIEGKVFIGEEHSSLL